MELTHRSPWELLVATILSAQCTDQRVNQILAPGQSLETFVPSGENIDHLTGDLVWRIHFRKGHGRISGNGVTTLIDVQFTSSDIQVDSA